MAWTPQFMLFSELKHGVTSYPVLTRFDPDKPTFLNIDWISVLMSCIIMQPSTDKESHHASTVLKDTGTCFFNLLPNGTRLQPIAFGSWYYTDFKRKYHSFLVKLPVADGALGNFPISMGRPFLVDL